MSNLSWFIVLYGASCIPQIFAFKYKSKDAQLGLLLLDGALTGSAFVFLWWAIGWWLLPVIIGNMGIGKLLEAMGLRGYDILISLGKA
jgi:hypothetical protein